MFICRNHKTGAARITAVITVLAVLLASASCAGGLKPVDPVKPSMAVIKEMPPETQAPSFSPAPTAGPTPDPSALAPDEFEATFLGVKGYGSIGSGEVAAAEAKVYRFLVNGEEKRFSVRKVGAYELQNLLMEGYDYAVKTEEDEVISVRLISPAAEYQSVVSGTPGLRTLRNFIMTAMAPVGTTLYVYGGGWDWQDKGSSIQSRTLGVSGTWVDFYKTNDANYLYKDRSDPGHSTYPFGGWNEYYYAGLDCSGYLGWVVYNTLESESGNDGYVYKSRDIAATLASRYGLGKYSERMYEFGQGELKCGDIVSMSDHVWICLGRCDDGSIVILHSSPTKSVTGAKGGGVQMSVLSRNGSSCEAYRLAVSYQQKYFPEWTSRYPVQVKDIESYLGFARTGNTGVFRWNIGAGGLEDPDGYLEMNAAEILKDIFGE